MHNQITQTQQHAAQKIEQCIDVVSGYLGKAIALPSVSFDQRGKAAGSAKLKDNHIRLNAILYQQNHLVFLHQVIPHEVAHIAVYQYYGHRKPHGKEWRDIMKNAFKLTPSVTHTMDTSDVSGKVFDYKCQCGIVQLSIRRHNNVVRGKRQYICRKCGKILAPRT